MGSILPMRRRAWMLAAAAVWMWGCAKTPPPPLRKFASEPPVEALDEAANAWAGYLRAADLARDVDPSFLLNRNPTPAFRRKALEALRPAVAKMIDASKKPCRAPTPLGDGIRMVPQHAAWRMIARCLVWRLEDQLSESQMDAALGTFSIATKVGYDLVQGGAVEATIGYALINDARTTLLPVLPECGAGQLKTLAANLARATPADGGIERCLMNEFVRQRRTLDALQRIIADGEGPRFAKSLGDPADNLAQLIQQMSADPQVRASVFDDLSAELFEEQRLALERSEKPVKDRGPWPKEGRKGRSWAPLAQAYFRAHRSVQDLRDVTLTRTRLLAAYSVAQQVVKARQVAPASLAGIPESMRIDPFTGRPLLYQAVGSSFDVYSVGENLRDDGGKSDESYASPDLTLELH